MVVLTLPVTAAKVGFCYDVVFWADLPTEDDIS